MTGASRSPAAEVVEDWTQLGRELIRKWTDYGVEVATKLDARTYDADTASAQYATGLSLSIESGFKIAWEALDSFTILTGGLDRPYIVESEVFTAALAPAKLELRGDLESGLRRRLPALAVQITPLSFEAGTTKFKLRVDATDCRAGTYRGTVRASVPGDHRDVNVRVTVP